MPDTMTGLRKASLRRTLWRAKLTAKALADQAFLTEPERHATALLRKAVKQQLKFEPDVGHGLCDVYRVENAWQAQVLRRDPDVSYAATLEELAVMLASPEPMRVFASRAAMEEFEERQTWPNGPFKTVFVDYA